MDTIRIVLVDDQQIVSNGIKALLINEEDIEIVGEAADCDEFLDAIHAVYEGKEFLSQTFRSGY